jgi:hypothetical protein
MNNTVLPITLTNGEKAGLTYFFRGLNVVFAKNPDFRETWNGLIAKGSTDVLDIITGLYIGYLCGQIVRKDGKCTLPAEVYALEEFTDLLPQEIPFIFKTWAALISPKKPTVSASRSSAKQGS